MNKSLIDNTIEEKVLSFRGLIEEESIREIGKLKDLPTLKALWLYFFQKDENKLKQLTEKRIKELGGSLD